MTSSDVRPSGKLGNSLPAISLGIQFVVSQGISLQNLDDSTTTVCVLQKKTRRGNQDAIQQHLSDMAEPGF